MYNNWEEKLYNDYNAGSDRCQDKGHNSIKIDPTENLYNYCIQIIHKTSCNKNRIWKILKTRFYTKDSRLGKWKEKCTNGWIYRQTDKVKPVIVTVN